MTLSKKTFRLDDDTIAKLRSDADRAGVTETEAVRRAIRAYGAEPSGTDPSAIDALVSQLATKDEQIARLQDALAAAQETTARSQALHAQERMALESAEQKAARRWRWPWQR